MFKNAVASSIFKYIFALVAGFLILLFFIKFAGNMTGTQEELSNAEVGFTVDDSLTALSVSEDQKESIPEDPWPSPIEFNIGKGSTCGKLSSSSYSYPSEKIIFSPSKLKGTQIQAWTQTWYYPFKISNFFFLSNKNSKYYLVSESNTGEVSEFIRSIDSTTLPTDTIEHIPTSFGVESITKNQVAGMINAAGGRYAFVKFIFFNTHSNIPQDSAVRYAEIGYADCEWDKNDEDCRGSVMFQGTKKSFFIGKPMFYGAIFADDFEDYTCQLSRIYKSIDIISGFYSEKAGLLHIKNQDCDTYNSIQANIDALKALTKANSMDYDKFHAVKNSLVKGNDETGGNSECSALF